MPKAKPSPPPSPSSDSDEDPVWGKLFYDIGRPTPNPSAPVEPRTASPRKPEPPAKPRKPARKPKA